MWFSTTEAKIKGELYHHFQTTPRTKNLIFIIFFS